MNEQLDPAADAKALVVKEFYNAATRAALNNDPEFFRAILDNVITTETIPINRVKSVVNDRLLQSLCFDRPETIAGWKSVALVACEYAVESEVTSAVKSEDDDFFKNLGSADRLEIIEDFDRFEFFSEPDPSYEDDEHKLTGAMVIQTPSGRALMGIMHGYYMDGEVITSDHLQRAKQIIESEPDIVISGALCGLLDPHVFFCAKAYAYKAIASGSLEYLKQAYSVLTHASSAQEEYRIKKAMDKYLFGFLSSVKGSNDCSEENSCLLIRDYASSIRVADQLYQALNLRV